MAPRKSAANEGPITIEPLDYRTVGIEIQGTMPLIVHAFDEKAQQMMLDQQMGKKREREPKDPWRCYVDSMHWITEKPETPTEEDIANATFGFPASGFKAAIVGSVRQYNKLKLPMTVLKVSIRVEGVLIPIEGHPHSRQDMVRLETGVADVRIRGEFWPWRAVLPVKYNAGIITLQTVVNLVNAAGFGGIGEWRPSAPNSATGSYGTFEVVPN